MNFNGFPILTELFVSYDGDRNFIPAPQVKRYANKYYLNFDQMQKLLAHVVGYVHIDDSVEQVFERILNSKYNSISSKLDAIASPSSIDELDRKIQDFKKSRKH